MSTTTMHFGPEWMRTKHQPLSRSQPPPSPPTNVIQSSGLSTYSALVSAMPSAPSEAGDVVHPFRYSKEELLKIYQEGGGKGGLGLEVERWEGVVREGGTEPVTLREMTEAEKKLFAGPLNSELRRRPSQSTEYLSPLTTSGLDRPRLPHNSSSTSTNNSPLRERFGALKRRDSAAGASDTVMPTLPRKPSLSALQTPTLSPREAPRSRVGHTPGFDGVLNNGDSWVARRRTSEASGKIGSGSSRESADGQLGIMGSGIREEKEEEPRTNVQLRPADDSNVFVSPSPRVQHEDPRIFINANANIRTSQMSSHHSFSANGTNNSDPFPVDRADSGPPPGFVDLAAVEWSYKDPTGQIQGPFRADLMQKWYNDGYFSSDLPMKRVRYDSQWTTVDELSQRAQGENIFLSSTFLPNPPSRGNASPLHTYPSSEHLYNEPFQPSPVRSLIPSTLESYLSSGSLASDSPSSSVGASHFGNPSPDPSVFGGRENKAYFGGDSNGRLSGLGVQNQPSPFAERRTIGHEFQSNPIIQSPSFGHFVSDRDIGFNTYGYNNVPVLHDAWGMSSNLPSSGFIVPRDQGNDKHYPLPNTSSNLVHRRPEGPHDDHIPRNFTQDAHYTNEDSANLSGKQPGPGAGALSYGHYQYPGQSPFQNVQEHHQAHAVPVSEFSENHGSADLYAYRASNSDPTIPQSLQSAHSNSSAIPTVPWNPLPEEQASEAIEGNPPIVVSNNLSNSPWNNVESAPSFPSQVNKSTADLLSEKEDSWKEGGLSNEVTPQDQTSTSQVSNQKQSRTPESIDRTLEGAESVPTLPPSSSASATGKKANKALSPSKAIQPPHTTSSGTGDSTTVPIVQKVAWVKEEENKKKIGSSPSVSLREIQEAEAKKLETRKTAERERERLARASASADVKEEVQPFTTSWGLPTSQVGARGTAPLRDITTVPAQAPATQPVWTTPLKQPATKKTMKEIQEEEETRKKIASKDTLAAAVPKRAYAETTTKTTPTLSSSSNNGNAWTTVGPSGKASSPATPPVRPSPHVPGSLSAVQTASISRASAPISKVATSSVVKKLVKQDDFPETPSHDFLKWLGDSLKGLNSSVNVEEIVSMLLSFPLDPDSSTVEIISDTIYSNSITLDGRRFASEFVAKRKADILARAKGTINPGKAASKPVSIADVVKATPKTAQTEWGFKVVNKKKGGRS